MIDSKAVTGQISARERALLSLNTLEKELRDLDRLNGYMAVCIGDIRRGLTDELGKEDKA